MQVELSKEECEIIWDALCEVTENKDIIWADENMPNKISALAERFSILQK